MKVVKAMEVTVESVDSDEPIQVGFTYDLVEYTKDNLWLQFNFENPEQVS